MNAGGSEVGERGQSVSVVRCRHGHYVRGFVAGRVKRRQVIIRTSVAGSSYEKHVVCIGLVDFVQQSLRKASAAPAIGEHAHIGLTCGSEGCLGLNGELDRVDGVGS